MRLVYALLVGLGIAIAAAVIAVVTLSSDGSDPSAPARSAAVKVDSSGEKVRVVVAGTNDSLVEQTDGGITGEGTFKATGAITDKGWARGYRGLSTLDPKVILLRYVTKSTKGGIAYAITIDTNVRPVISRWRIESATGAYKGLHGKGTETENATYTVSYLKGTVWH